MSMDCLHCGDCCERMSPISNPDPCPHIVRVEDKVLGGKPFVFCGCYDVRPQQCRDHRFPASKCPIGIDVLGIRNANAAHMRLNEGYRIITEELTR